MKILIMNFNILDVVQYWFDKKNVNKWFNATKEDDEEITNKFLPYLDLEDNSLDYSLNLKEKLGYIILYDQMVRHFYRVLLPEDNFIQKYHSYALVLSEQIFSSNLDIHFNAKEKCFLLLPLRHTFNLKYLEIVISKMKEYRKNEDDPMYDRFWRATLISYSQIKTSSINIEAINENILDIDIFNILDKEHNSAHNLSNILPLNCKNKFYRSFESLFTSSVTENDKTLVISLSGGVDSMVASFVMYHCCKQMGIKLIAVHINYGNRDTCKFEVELIKRWTKLLNIPLYIHHIEHLKRPGSVNEIEANSYAFVNSDFSQSGLIEKNQNLQKCVNSGLSSKERTLYEEVTRIIRFQMYKRFNCPVILGHNLDDCEENMMTNIRKSKCYDNLLGMKKIGQENNIILLRPMLDISKAEIYDFAYEYEIPHLYDSTPKWSDRGKMRNELIPFLNKFDPSFIPGLFNISETLTNMYKIYSTTVLEEFRKNKILHEKDTIRILINSQSCELDYGYSFWKDIIYGIIYFNNLSVKKEIIPSNKSIRFFSNKLSLRHYGKISLNNFLTFNFTKDEIIMHKF